jgi:hypothetical protein
MELFADSTGIGWLVPAIGGGMDRIYLVRKQLDGLPRGAEEPGVQSQHRVAPIDTEPSDVRSRQAPLGERVDDRISLCRLLNRSEMSCSSPMPRPYTSTRTAYMRRPSHIGSTGMYTPSP